MHRGPELPAMSVNIRTIPIGGKLDDFVNVVEPIYRGDPNYVRPLDVDLKRRLHPNNPFFEHAEGTVFTAYKGSRCVGRCTAQIDRAHLDRHADGAGFFGFFDTEDDPEVAQALLDAAGDWLRRRGMKRMRGPISLSFHEEIGCLVEGFDTPPMIMMPHHRPYQGGLIEKSGLYGRHEEFRPRRAHHPRRVQRRLGRQLGFRAGHTA
jgi:hypothetical protein